MIERRIHKELVASIDSNPAVALLGPCQAGKTTLALEIAHTRPSLYLDLASPSDRVKLTDPEGYLADHEDTLVILDEVCFIRSTEADPRSRKRPTCLPRRRPLSIRPRRLWKSSG